MALVCVTGLVAAGSLVSLDSTVIDPPVEHRPHPADAILVLGGEPYQRFETGRELAARGIAPVLLISRPLGPMPGMDELCGPLPGVEVRCFHADPWTTRGEARELGKLAREQGWRSVVVVSQRTHLARARHLVARCFEGEVQMVDSGEHLGAAATASQYFYQTGAWAKAFGEEGC